MKKPQEARREKAVEAFMWDLADASISLYASMNRIACARNATRKFIITKKSLKYFLSN
jgi:hypothetical protein